MKPSLSWIIAVICLTTCEQLTGQIEPESEAYFFTMDSDTFQGKYSDIQIKNGNVVQYRKLVYSWASRFQLAGTDLKIMERDTQVDWIAEGTFNSGRKSGWWTYYIDFGAINCWESFIIPDHLIYYSLDTLVFENATFPYQRITYVNDSSLIFGQTLSGTGKLIDFHCANGECLYWFEQKRNIITKSTSDELDEIIWSLEYGDFERRIHQFTER